MRASGCFQGSSFFSSSSAFCQANSAMQSRCPPQQGNLHCEHSQKASLNMANSWSLLWKSEPSCITLSCWSRPSTFARSKDFCITISLVLRPACTIVSKSLGRFSSAFIKVLQAGHSKNWNQICLVGSHFLWTFSFRHSEWKIWLHYSWTQAVDLKSSVQQIVQKESMFWPLRFFLFFFAQVLFRHGRHFSSSLQPWHG